MSLPDRLLAVLNGGPPPAGYLVAFSGGRDSSVLLHALAARRDRLHAPLRAIHINHGLHPDAARWERQCDQFSADLGVELISKTVEIDPADPRGLEAAARAARYRTLETELRAGEWLLTAHHADDQLETVLLQLLRGGGPAGIAAMPARAPFGAGQLVRPLLEIERQQIAAYADTHRLTLIDDPSNSDRQRDRNYLRHEVIPRLKQRWPAAAITVSRAARHAAQATSLLHDLAELDLAQIPDPKAETLPVKATLALGPGRAENILRHWLAKRGLPIPDTRRLDSLLKQAAEAADDKAPQVTWTGAEARCWRGRLYAFEPMSPRPPPLPTRWHGEPLALKGLGELRAVPAKTGLRADIFTAGVELRWRSGGERLQPVGQRHHRDLKDLLREAGVVPWMRERIPILWFEGEVAAVADLWIAGKFVAQSDTPAMRIEWHNASDAISAPA